MKTQIENILKLSDNSHSYQLIADEFSLIIGGCLHANNESDLRDYFTTLNLLRFQVGFGSSHFWVCQNNETQRILFIDFLNQ